MADRFDLIVIGDGQGGDPLAKAFAAADKSVALVERGPMGGTCINTGCTPSKTLASSARTAYLARRASDFGIHVENVRVEMPEVVARKRRVVTDFESATRKHLETTANLTLLPGTARFTGPKAIEVDVAGEKQAIAGETIVIDTGGRPTVPKIDGLDEVPFLDSTSIMDIQGVPERLVILGGGYNALELGQMFRRFGSEVTIVEACGQLMGREDADVADTVADILREDGIEIVLQAKATKAAGGHEGIELTLQTPAGEKKVGGTHLLVAVGRTPNTEELNLPAAGIETDPRGCIKVDERLATSAEGVYAIGDVNGGPAFTHISYDDFRILRANLLEGGSRTTRDRLVPYTVFIDPQLGRVGLTERKAREQGRDFLVAKMPMTDVARAIETGETRGFMKAIVDRQSKQILGCAILGAEGGELMAMVEIAMMAHLPYTALKDAIFAHPTLAEAFNNLFMTLGD